MVRKTKNPPPAIDPQAPARNTRGAQARAEAHARKTGTREPEAADDFIPLLDQDTHAAPAIPPPHTPEEAQRAARGVYPTPLVYLKGEMPRKRATRSRAVRDAIHHDFCEITHHPNSCFAVEGCHCVPRNWMGPLSEKRMRIIEYHLGFRYAKSLNLDTRINIFLLLVSYHRYFDGDGLIFLPLIAIALLVQQYALENINRGLGEKILYTTALPMPEGGWAYMMLNLNMPNTHVILRKILKSIVDGDQTIWIDTSDYTVHKYPFADFPIIRSHVHPCLVSLNAWEKLRKIEEYPAHWTTEQEFCARLVVDIVDLWFDEDVPDIFKPDTRITAEMRRLPVTQQARLVEDADEGTPPPDEVGLFAGAAEEAEAPDSIQSTPTRKRPAPSRRTAGRADKRARNDPGPSRLQ